MRCTWYYDEEEARVRGEGRFLTKGDYSWNFGWDSCVGIGSFRYRLYMMQIMYIEMDGWMDGIMDS